MLKDKIKDAIARRVFDSRGNPTIETELFLENNLSAKAMAPSGASSGKKEAIEIRDNNKLFNGLNVSKCVDVFNNDIKNKIVGKSCLDQNAFDELLISLDGTSKKSKLGGNLLIALSLSNLLLASKLNNLPLFKYVNYLSDNIIKLPKPEIQIFGGGAHAQNSLSFQDFLVYFPNIEEIDYVFECVHSILFETKQLLLKKNHFSGFADEGGFWPTFNKYQNILDILSEGIHKAKLKIETDVSISIDFAANQYFDGTKYNIDGKYFSKEEYTKELISIYNDFSVTLFEDPYAESEVDSFFKLKELNLNKLKIIGDDLTVTNSDILKTLKIEKLIDGIIIKPNQCGTITETINALKYSKEKNLLTILSARSGDTEESYLSHLATGWQTDMIKVGSFSRSERTSKWNELIRIKELL